MATRKKVTREDNENLEIKDKEMEQETTNIDLSAIRKKRFSIDGDPNRILYLDTSDFSILSRIEEVMPKMQALVRESFAARGDSEDEQEDVKLLQDIDSKLRDLLDYTFDSNVSEVCAPSGSMYDLFNGELRFEHILDALIKLYSNNIEREYRILNRKISQYTAKYTSKKGK